MASLPLRARVADLPDGRGDFPELQPMGLTRHPEESGLCRVNAALYRRRGVFVRQSPPGSDAHWGEAFFGLAATGAFRGASADQQQAILDLCGRSLVEEAVFIERAGVAFATKMAVLAETMDERQTYALFAADEANHLAQLQGFLPSVPSQAWQGNPFLALLNEAVQEGSRRTLQYVVQVVLEGWGLSHYRDLREACQSSELRDVFSSILLDEASHHGVGVLLLEDHDLDAREQEHVVHVMERFLGLVRLGPAAVMATVEAQLGSLSLLQRRRLLVELGATAHAAARLEQLKKLMSKVAAGRPIVERLEGVGAFAPPSEEELV